MLRGAASPNFPKVLKENMHEFNPDMVVLVKTRVSGAVANRVISNIGMPKSHRVQARGFSSGIWVLWKECVEVMVFVNNGQFVYLKFKFPAFSDWVLLQ